ncbi:MAG: hypothetical protein V1793_19565 [Pseudomonadota bacterium]
MKLSSLTDSGTGPPKSEEAAHDPMAGKHSGPLSLLARITRYSKQRQQGQMIVELALMMPFLGMVLLAMFIISEVSSAQGGAMESLRSSMRQSMYANAGGVFHKKKAKTAIFVDVPGKMKQVFKTPAIFQEFEINYYEGSYQGSGKNLYRTLGQPYREINE